MRMLSSGVQKCLRAVEDRAELDAVVGELERVGEAEDLEAARVGEDGAVPVHERVQTAGVAHDVGTGAQVEVVGVGEQHLRADVVQLRRGDALDGRAGADRHEDRRLDGTVGGVEASPARGGGGVAREELEVEEGHACDCT